MTLATPAPLTDLRARFGDRLILPQDTRYDPARTLWNAVHDRRPAAIVRPPDEAGVAAAVLLARDADLQLAVRGGGHSMSGQSMADGGLTVDLGALAGVRVDPVARVARVGGGALLGDVMAATAPHDLAMPFGHVSHTGVGGLTLGGGLGWLMRRDGMTIDRLRSMRLVTADGEILHVDASEQPELFWALRGGGGNFGIVTEFEIELAPFGPAVLAGMVLHPLERAPEALAFSRDFMDAAPRELTVFEVLMTVPPAPPFPQALWGRPALAIALVYAGDPAEGERVVAPLRHHGPPALDLVAPMPPVAVQAMIDPTAPHGMRNLSRSHFLRSLPGEAIDALVERHAAVSSPLSQIITARMGGAVDDVPADATAYPHRGADRLVWTIGSWLEGDDAQHAAWVQDVHDAMRPWSTGGVYVNALQGEGDERVRAAYGEATHRRLVAVKDRWDPDNVFRLNQNVAPSAR